MNLRRVAWMFGATVVASCANKPARPQPPEPTRTPAKPDADPELAALADEIDPGPQAPLMTAMPAWLRGETKRDREVVVREAREALLAWDKQSARSGEQLMATLLGLGRAMISAEQAVAAGSDDPELLLALSRVYAILGLPFFSGEQSMMQQVLQFAVQALETYKPGEANAAQVMAGLRDMFSRAGALHRRTAAQLLRHHPGHPEIAGVLGRLADADRMNEDFDRALRLRRLAVARLGTRASGGDLVELASICYRALELECGDRAFARARALGAGKSDPKAALAWQQRMTQVEDDGKRARRALALAGEPDADLVAGSERGHLLLLLGRSRDAEALYTRLRAAHPEDARPITGLAKVDAMSAARIGHAATWVEAAAKLQNRDRDYYEIALGTIGMKFMLELLPKAMQGESDVAQLMQPLLEGLQRHAEGYRAYEPARAALVEVLVTTAKAALPGIVARDSKVMERAVAGLQAQMGPLLKQYPDSLDVRRLGYISTLHSRDWSFVAATLHAPLPPTLAADNALQRMRFQTWLDATLTWRSAEELPALYAAGEQLVLEPEECLRPTLQSAMFALMFRVQGDRSAGETAATFFEALAQQCPAMDRVAALNNAGVLRVALGEVARGFDLYKAALEIDPKSLPVLLNAAATALSVGGTLPPDMQGLFDLVAREAGREDLRLQARAWRHEQADKGMGDVEVTRREFVEALAKERARGWDNSPRLAWGAYNAGEWYFNLEYSVHRGFQIVNTMTTTFWLVQRAPGIDALMDAAEPAKKGVKGKASKTVKVGKSAKP